MNPVIDILLATYNGEKYLKEQIESILSQSYKNIHIIIRDDGSTDHTLNIIHEIMKRHPTLITLIDDRSHLGVIGSFSQLLMASKALYVMFCDQDDVWLPHKIESTLDKMMSLEVSLGNDKPILVHSDLKVVDKNLEEISASYWSYTKIKPKEGFRLNRLLVQNEVTGCTMMMNRSLIDIATPIFSESVMHDWWLALVASTFGHIGVVREPLILYRQHEKNTLGAIKYGASLFKNISINQHKKNVQSSELLKRYQKELKPEKERMINDYVSMKQSSFMRNRFLTFKHRFYKHGLLRNLFYFLLMRHP